MSAGEDKRLLNLETAAVDAAGRGIQTLLILNGGACLGVLSLYGVLVTSAYVRVEFLPLIASMPRALKAFTGGAVLTIPLWFFAYSANLKYSAARQFLYVDRSHHDRLWDCGRAMNQIGMFLVLLSTLCFLYGVYCLYCSLPEIQPKKVDDGERCIVCVLSA